MDHLTPSHTAPPRATSRAARGRQRPPPPPASLRPALRVWPATLGAWADALVLATRFGLRPLRGAVIEGGTVWATLHVSLDVQAWPTDQALFLAEVARNTRDLERDPPIAKVVGRDGASISTAFPADALDLAKLRALPVAVGSGARVTYSGLPTEEALERRRRGGRGVDGGVEPSDGGPTHA